MVEKGQLVIISGMSGAGKTVAVQSFEDLGYFCVDNLPPTLLPTFLELIRSSTNDYGRVAVVMDLRGRDFFDGLEHVIDEIDVADDIEIHVLFLDAEDGALVKRYKETRRNHPLAANDSPLKGIEQERVLLSGLKARAQFVYDTSRMKSKQLREKITHEFTPNGVKDNFQVVFTSFGYKHGIPIDADLVFDVRFLPNPFYVEALRQKTGLDDDVSQYVTARAETKEFLKHLGALLDFLIPQYKKEGRAQIVIAVGCTGGQHRSVALSQFLNQFYQEKYSCHVVHRDMPLANR